jgi:hypothetical protein
MPNDAMYNEEVLYAIGNPVLYCSTSASYCYTLRSNAHRETCVGQTRCIVKRTV